MFRRHTCVTRSIAAKVLASIVACTRSVVTSLISNFAPYRCDCSVVVVGGDDADGRAVVVVM